MRSEEDSALLPTVDEATLTAADPRSLRHPPPEPAVLPHTTGTTGTTFPRARSSAELVTFSEHVRKPRPHAKAENPVRWPRGLFTFFEQGRLFA